MSKVFLFPQILCPLRVQGGIRHSTLISCRFLASITDSSQANAEKEQNEGNTVTISNPADSKHELEELPRENAFPVFAPRRGPSHPVYALVPNSLRDGEDAQLADYVLFEHSMLKSKVPYSSYRLLDSDERRIYCTHLKAVEARRLSYKCPLTKRTYHTICRLLHNGECCGEACRHCPYQLSSCPEEVRKKVVWNGAFYI